MMLVAFGAPAATLVVKCGLLCWYTQLGRRRRRVSVGKDLDEVFARDFKYEEAAVFAAVARVHDIIQLVFLFGIKEVPEAVTEVQFVDHILHPVPDHFFLISTPEAWGGVC